MIAFYILFACVNSFQINVYFPKLKSAQLNTIKRQNVYAKFNASEHIDRKINESLNNVKSVIYDEKNEIWIMNLFDDETDPSKLNPANFNNLDDIEDDEDYEDYEDYEDDDQTPEEIRKQINKIVDERLQKENIAGTHEVTKDDEIMFLSQLNNIIKNNTGFPITKPENYGDIVATNKDLKMLTNIITIEWTKNWIHDMVEYKIKFPGFMYHDMFVMRDFAIQNTSQRYFYIGYYPDDIRTIHGPYYIGAFELIPQERAFIAHMVVQNPNYMIDHDRSTTRMINFKKEIRAMCEDAFVFFRFHMLKNKSHDRYYLTWLYEDDA